MKTQLTHLGIVYAIALFLCAISQAKSNVGMEILPEGRPFRLTFADPREIRMAISFHGDSQMKAFVGNYFSILGWRPIEGDWQIHFGLEGAGFFTMRKEGARFPLETADGLIGLYIEGSQGPWMAQFRYTHVSAHLADGSNGSAIPYSRETAVLRAGYAPDDSTHFYGGFTYLAHTVPVVPRAGLQLGGSYFYNLTGVRLAPFVSWDLQWQADAPVNPSFSAQLGMALNNPPRSYHSFRFFYSYFTGVDPRGQYFNVPYTSHSFGIEMQI